MISQRGKPEGIDLRRVDRSRTKPLMTLKLIGFLPTRNEATSCIDRACGFKLHPALTGDVGPTRCSHLSD
jgi:hypothetical protein